MTGDVVLKKKQDILPVEFSDGMVSYEMATTHIRLSPSTFLNRLVVHNIFI